MSDTLTTASLPPLTQLTEDEAMFRDEIRSFAEKRVGPLVAEMESKLKAAIEGAFPRRTKTKADNSHLPQADAVVTEPSDYPFSTSDLEYRDDSLHEALDLRAVVLRIK